MSTEPSPGSMFFYGAGAFVRRLIPDDELTPETLDYWATEYLHAYRQLGEFEKLHSRIAELELVVAKLPKTVDGVPVTPGMELWCERGHQIEPCFVDWHRSEVWCNGDGCFDDSGPIGYGISDCYSTQASAKLPLE